MEKQETVIEFFKGDKVASCTVPGSTALKSYLMKMAVTNPDEVQIVATNKDGSIFVHVPTKWVKIKKPRTVVMSEERKKAMADMLREYREAARASKSLDSDCDEEDDDDDEVDYD